MKLSKEVATKAGSHFFRAVADILDAATVFYKSGHPEEGDQMILVINKMLESLPEINE